MRMPHYDKVNRTMTKLIEVFTKRKKPYLAFSGGKDSTCVLDMLFRVCEVCDYRCDAVYSNTGLEFPEVQSFVNDCQVRYGSRINIIKVRHEYTLTSLFKKIGYPACNKQTDTWIYNLRQALRNNNAAAESASKKRLGKLLWYANAPFEISPKCCTIVKKKPMHNIEIKNGYDIRILGMLANESLHRYNSYRKNGCNAFFEDKISRSMPIGFWSNQDVLRYLYENNVPIAKVYGNIEKGKKGKYRTTLMKRTGCMFCPYGTQTDCKNGTHISTLQYVKNMHPKIYRFIMDENGLGFGKVYNFIQSNVEDFILPEENHENH